MPNTLNKLLTRTYLPGSAAVPADPGRPYRPAQWITYQKEVCDWGAGEGGAPVSSGAGAGSLQYGADLFWGRAPVYSCRKVPTMAFIPAQAAIPATPGSAAVPAQVVVDNGLGWNSRARSIDSFDFGGEATFVVPRSAIGVVVGLCDTHASSGYADIEHAFYMSRGQCRVMERGVGKTAFVGFDDGAVFSVRRVGGVVEYLIDGASIYVSAALTDGPMVLSAALYSAGDTVDAPTISALSVGELEMPAVSLLGADREINGGTLALPAFTLDGREAIRVNLDLPAFTLIGADRAYAEGRLVLPAIEIEGSAGEIAPGYAIGDLVLPLLQFAGGGLSGEVGSGDITLPAALALGADRPYADGRLTIPPVSAWGHAYEGPNFASIYSGAGVDARFSSERTITIALSEGMRVASIFGASRLVEGDIRETVQAALSLVGQREITANAIVVIYPGQVVEQGGVGDTWVVNAESMGSTRYEGFDFNSYAKIGDSYFGCRADGIYQLDGDTDAGDPIRAMVSFGKQDFGTSMLKRITNAYIGVSSEGRMFLRIIAEGQDYTYAARSADENLQVQRIDTGKGLRANYLEFELYNEDGNDFELASVEFAVLPMSRRI